MRAFLNVATVAGLILSVSIVAFGDVNQVKQEIITLGSNLTEVEEDNRILRKEIQDVQLEYTKKTQELYKEYQAANNTGREHLHEIQRAEAAKYQLLECIRDMEIERQSNARKEENLDFAIESLNQELRFWKLRKDNGFIDKCFRITKNEQPIGELETRTRSLDDEPSVVEHDLRIARTEYHSMKSVRDFLISKLITKKKLLAQYLDETIAMIEKSKEHNFDYYKQLVKLEGEVKDLGTQRAALFQNSEQKKNEYSQKVTHLNELKLQLAQYFTAKECYSVLLSETV